MRNDWRPDLSNIAEVAQLRPRDAAYFNILEYGRHIGLHVKSKECMYWVARCRLKNGGYTQKRLSPALLNGEPVRQYCDAVQEVVNWFSIPTVASNASDSYPRGSKRELNICPIGDLFTVGHALKIYLEWKMIAATRSHFETLVNLANYHLVPRVSHVVLEEFTGDHVQKLAVSVLETPPKYGKVTPQGRTPIGDLESEELRKRKKTFNALISILRGAFELSWERGHLSSNQPSRSLRRLPNRDRPRAVHLDRSQCQTLIEACHDDLKPLVCAALYTGCRISELVQMKVADFSPDTGSVFIDHPKGRTTRYVLLPEEGLQFFREKTINRPPNDRMFIKENGRGWGGEYKSYFQRARSVVGLSRNVTFHGLRHTYASQLLQSGASLMTVAAQLGHANTQTVSSTYGHLTARAQADDIERCFASLSAKANSVVPLTSTERAQEALTSELPVFRHRSAFHSWPRANHSRYSGQLLPSLKDR